jgi:hypothetical protein
MAGHIPDSASQEWITPEKELEPVRKTFQTIDLDPCSNKFSHVKATTEYTLPEKDGLVNSWTLYYDKQTNLFCNPPWGQAWRRLNPETKQYEYIGKTERNYLKNNTPDWESVKKQWSPCFIDKWIRRAHSYKNVDVNSILLVPAYVGTKVWQQIVWPDAAMICFPEGRIKFELYNSNTGEMKTGPSPIDCAFILFSKNSLIKEMFYYSFKNRGQMAKGWRV